jgi:hypothetical protein
MCQESLINYLDTALNPPPPSESGKGSGEVVPRTDIEILVHLGEQISHYESVETEYSIKMPKSIKQHARLIDEKLAEITVCDPAVGSGAFPVGMMHEIVRARSALTPYFNDVHERTPYTFKRHAIRNCLYGVDIDAGAVEIAKLRLWLSLVVDEEDVKQIKPLPNLDYKIVVGNSLIGFPFKSTRLQEVETLMKQVVDETDHNKKEKLRTAIDHKLQECFAASKKSFGYEVTFDFEIYFSEVFHRNGGFDVVVGNPPYITIGGKEDMGIAKHEKEYYLTNYNCTAYKPNYFVFFYEKGYKLIRRFGFLIYIVPRTFIDNIYFGNIRMFLKNNARICLVIKVNSEVFESGITGGSSICGVSKNQPTGKVKVAVLDSTEAISNPLWRIIDQEKVLFGENNAFVFESPEIMSLFTKIKSKGIPLGNYCSVNNGVNTGNAANFLLADQPKSQTYRKLLEGKDVHRYFITWGGNWINYDPNLKKKIKVQDLKTRQSRIDFALRDSRIFDSPKIVIRQTSDKLIGCLDEARFVTRHSTHCIVVEREGISLKYILAVFNSKLMNFYYQTLIPETGKAFAEVKAIHVKQFPIYPAKNNQHVQIELLVNLIMETKSLDPDTDTTRLEREIDQLVYQLYDLTPEEIAIVEESIRAK